MPTYHLQRRAPHPFNEIPPGVEGTFGICLRLDSFPGMESHCPLACPPSRTSLTDWTDGYATPTPGRHITVLEPLDSNEPTSRGASEDSNVVRVPRNSPTSTASVAPQDAPHNGTGLVSAARVPPEDAMAGEAREDKNKGKGQRRRNVKAWVKKAAGWLTGKASRKVKTA
ncbi:hypothetical protein BKA80DRAFT_255146 [Phyllosticta citrichinensis]